MCWLQVNEMNEKMSFKVGVKFTAPFYMGRILISFKMGLLKMIQVNFQQ